MTAPDGSDRWTFCSPALPWLPLRNCIGQGR